MSKELSRFQLQEQPNCMAMNSGSKNIYDETNERLQEFVKYFVEESEAKFHCYHLILEGELKKSGKFTGTLSGAAGKGVGGAAGIVGMFFGLPPGGATALSKAGKMAASKISDKVGSEKYEKEVRRLSDLVKLSQKDKAAFRKMLVEAGFDIFYSFEMQFMRVVLCDGTSNNAIHDLAKDAVNRTVNYLKKNESASLTEGVVMGKSKRQDVDCLRPGFWVTYKYRLCTKTWNTAKLYSEVGLLILKDGKPCYFKKKNSDTGNYGYRRCFSREKCDALSKEYIVDNIAESNSGQFTDYKYVLDLQDMELKWKSILEKINLDDKNLAESRIKEVFQEVKCEIIEELNILKSQYHEDRKILESIEMSINNLHVEECLLELKQYLDETKEEMIKLIKEESQDTTDLINKMSGESKERHENTDALLEKLNEGIETVHMKQGKNEHALRQISAETANSLNQINEGIRTLLGRQMRNSVWFNMRESVTAFTGREMELTWIDSNIQQGTVVITGLSGVGKSQLAIKYARTRYNKDDSVIWINAKTSEVIKHSLFRLYKKLGYKIKDESGIEKDVTSVAEEVYDYFSDQKSIFIFDDVEGYDTIKDVLPLGLPTDVDKPHVLITSNSLQVKKGVYLRLRNFNTDESMDFVKKFYSMESDSQKDEIQELSRKLHNYPLALHQAIVYITEEDKRLKNVNQNKKFTITDYLEEFERKTEDLLECEEFQVQSDYNKTTFTAIHISLSKISGQKYAPEALEILNTMAYLDTENIPASFFLELTNGDERKLGSVIQLLKDYSIVTGKGLLDIHGMVQKVLRLELGKKKEDGTIMEENILDKALESFGKYMTDYESIEYYIPHIISVWNYANKYDSLIETFIVSFTQCPALYTSHIHMIVENSPYTVFTSILNKIEETHPKEFNAIINRKTNGGVTSIHCAAISADEEKVKLLVDKGANVDAQTKHKWTLLHLAAKNGFLNTVSDLLRRNANINAQTEYKFTPLHLAVKGKHLVTVRLLLSKGASVGLKTNRGFVPLHFAVVSGSIDIVDTLLQETTDIEIKTRHEYTPLHLAAKGGNMEVLNALLKRGADIEKKTRLKFTPLHFAADQGHLNVVEALLRQNATVNVKDANNFTPLHLAALNGHNGVVLRLLRQNAEIDTKTTKGCTPLHFAIERGHFMVVKSLIANKATVNARNKEGKTALDIAIERNFSEIKDYVVQHYQSTE